VNAIDVAQNIAIWGHNFYVFISISTRCNQSKIRTALLVIFYCVKCVLLSLSTDLIDPTN